MANTSVATFIAIWLPVELLLFGIIALFVTAPPILRRKKLDPARAQLKSLRIASPIVNTLVLMAVVAKPYLEYLQKNNWDPGILPSELELPITAVSIISVYALLGAILFFYFCAVRNINVLSGERLRSPYSVLFMIVPISNLVVIPYLEYFAYQRSRALLAPEYASKIRAALLVGSAFALIACSVALGLPSENTSDAPRYDPLALLVLTVCTSGAGGILTTRVINGTFEAQEALERQRIGDFNASAVGIAGPSRWIELAKLYMVALLVGVALTTAMFPTLPSLIAPEYLRV